MSYVIHAESTTRHGAPLTIRSYENGRGALVYISGERIGSIDTGSWEGHAPLLFSHRYPSHPTMAEAVDAVLVELGAPR